METLGFVGLGHMGAPMVQSLLRAGYRVRVYDVVPEAVHALAAVGAIPADSPRSVTEAASVVFLMLQTGLQVKSVCEGKDGIFQHILPEALIVDCSSIDVESARSLQHDAEACGLRMLDAPVSGGVMAAEEARLTFMVGGSYADFVVAEPYLQAMGKRIVYTGAGGSGVAAKICNNMILGVSMIAVSEAFHLAERLGLSAEKLFEVASNASGQCWSLTQYCPWPNVLPNVPSSHEYKAGFTANMMLKDLRLSQEAASSAGVVTPLGAHARELYEQFVLQ